MDLVSTNLYALDLAAEVIDTGNLLDAAEIRLFQNDVQPDKDSVAADFDVADYVGYADEAITWLAPSIADDGTIEVLGTVGEFRPTNSVTPNSVYGAILLTAGGDMMFGGRFDDAPLPMESATDAILITVRYRPVDQSLAVVVS